MLQWEVVRCTCYNLKMVYGDLAGIIKAFALTQLDRDCDSITVTAFRALLMECLPSLTSDSCWLCARGIVLPKLQIKQ